MKTLPLHNVDIIENSKRFGVKQKYIAEKDDLKFQSFSVSEFLWDKEELTFLITLIIFRLIGYANFGNNENFPLLHFAVHQINDRE